MQRTNFILSGFSLLLLLTIESCTTFQMYPSLKDGLVAEYLFNGTANDTSGNGNNGSVMGPNLVSNRFDKPVSAYQFHGKNGEQIIIERNLLKEYSSATICVWIYLETNVVDNQVRIISSRPGDGNQTWGLMIFGDNYEGIGMRPTLNILQNRKIYSGQIIEIKKWYFITASYEDNKIMQIFIDGKKVAEKESTDGLGNFEFQTVIGSENGNYVFPGVIDDIRVYNRKLTEKEIIALYNER